MNTPASVSPKRKLPVLDGKTTDWQLADPIDLGPYASRIVEALITAIIPPPPAPHSPELKAGIALTLRSWLPYMNPWASRGLRLCLWLLELAPLFLFFAPSRLSKLAPARASSLLDEMTHGRYRAFRMIVVAVRGLILGAYFDRPEVHQAIDYAPLPFVEDRVQLRKRLLSGEAPTDADSAPNWAPPDPSGRPSQSPSLPPPSLH